MENISITHTTGYLVDYDGYIIEPVTIVLEDFNEYDAPGNLIMKRPPFDGSIWTPKWNRTEWIEGATQQEIDELTKPQPHVPTDTEILGQQMTEREIEAMYQGQQLSDMELRLLALEGM